MAFLFLKQIRTEMLGGVSRFCRDGRGAGRERRMRGEQDVASLGSHFKERLTRTQHPGTDASSLLVSLCR